MEPDVGGRFIPSFVYKGYKRNLSLGRPPRGRGLNLVKESSSEILVKDSQIRLQLVQSYPRRYQRLYCYLPLKTPDRLMALKDSFYFVETTKSLQEVLGSPHEIRIGSTDTAVWVPQRLWYNGCGTTWVASMTVHNLFLFKEP